MTDKLDRLILCLDRLPTLARIAYLLSTMDGLTDKEVAFRMGRPLEEVEGHLTDALFLLHRMMDEDNPPP